MNLNHLDTFAALAEAGSFAGAARQRGLPTSTVSAHIAALEHSLGLQLVVRTTRQSRLTEAGRKLAVHARMVAEVAAEAALDMEQERTRPSGALHVCLPFTFAAELLAPMVGKFAARYPGIRVELTVSNEPLDLIEHGFDLAVRVGRIADSTLTGRKLASATRLLVAARSYLQHRPAPTRLADLDDHHFIGFAPSGKLRLAGPAGTVQWSYRSHISANDPKTVASILLAGSGIAYLPRFLIAEQLAKGELEVILPSFHLRPVPLSVVHYGRKAKNLRAELFITFLSHELSANPTL